MDKREIYYQHTWNGYELTFAFDPFFIDKIKTRVPKDQRSYDPKAKSWTLFRQADFEKLRDASFEHYMFVRIEGDTGHTPTGWVPANQRTDHVDPLAKENRRR